MTCACGCGSEVPVNTGRGRQLLYLVGHRRERDNELHRAARAALRAAMLCTECSAPVAPRLTRCRRCHDVMLAFLSMHRPVKVHNCVDCGEALPVTKGRGNRPKRCEGCAVLHSRAKRGEMMARRKVRKVCLHCNAPAMPGRTRCEACHSAALAGARNRRAKAARPVKAKAVEVQPVKRLNPPTQPPAPVKWFKHRDNVKPKPQGPSICQTPKTIPHEELRARLLSEWQARQERPIAAERGGFAPARKAVPVPGMSMVDLRGLGV